MNNKKNKIGQKSLTFQFLNGESKTFKATICDTDKQCIILNELLREDDTVCIEIKHHKMQTLLDLTNVQQYVLYSFNEEKNLEGISYCDSRNGEDFKLLNQGKWLMFEKLK